MNQRPTPIRPVTRTGQTILPGFTPPREPAGRQPTPDRLELQHKYKGIAEPERLCSTCRHFRPPIVRAETAAAFGRCDRALIKATQTHPWHGEWRGCGLHQRPSEHSMTAEELADYREGDHHGDHD